MCKLPLDFIEIKDVYAMKSLQENILMKEKTFCLSSDSDKDRN
jgi:hypothetical protein